MIDYLLNLPRFSDDPGAYRPGLERMEALLDAMGRPHEVFSSIHVAGTNGKGSTASMIAAIASASGLRTGLHTSPHLLHVAERLRVDGVPAPEAWLRAATQRYRPALDRIRPSFFEVVVALSFRYFADAGVDLAVVEVGLGGRLDATNVLCPKLAVVTSIGFDHTDLLGSTLDAIAREKAGIFKPGIPAVVGDVPNEALEALAGVAKEQAAPLHHVPREVEVEQTLPVPEGTALRVSTPLRTYEQLVVGLGGSHQVANALVALRAAELSVPALARSPTPARTGLREVRRLAGLRGRLDVLSEAPLIVADVAHNADGLAAALAFMQRRRPPAGRLYVLFGAMRDKDVEAMAQLLAEAQALVWPAELASPRSLSRPDLTKVLRRAGATLADPAPLEFSLTHFCRVARSDDALLVTGSHLLVAEVLPVTGQR